MSASRKLTRRKRKLHHGPSSLLRATIQEYGIYDRQVDAFKAQFIDSFDFLENWQKGIKANDKIVLQSSLQSSSDPFCDKDGVCRDVSLEEELQLRLNRMTTMASTLRYLCNKEREHKLTLYQQCNDCRSECINLISDMVQHFHRETGILQQRLLELDGTVEELEHERDRVKGAYTELMGQATKTIESMDSDIQGFEKREAYLRQELERLRADYATAKDENTTQEKELVELRNEAKKLKLELKGSDSEHKTDEIASSQYQMLLQMALEKLKLYEDKVLTPVQRSDKMMAKLSIDTSSSTGSGTGALVSASLPQTPTRTTESPFSLRTCDFKGLYRKKRINSDNLSVTSFDTGSEVSLPIDCSRSISEDRISNASIHSQTLPKSGRLSASPKVVRRKTKWRPFFGRGILRKSPSSESHLLSMSRSAERLPTITDEAKHTGSIRDIGLSIQAEKIQLRRERLNLRSRSEERKCFQDSDSASSKYSLVNNARSLDSLDQVDQASSNSDVKDNSAEISYDSMLPEEQDSCSKLPELLHSENDVRQNPTSAQKLLSKVKRTSSFAALRPKKNGLVALAKDIEKKFRKKRRSKTADFSELLRINLPYEEVGGNTNAGVLDETLEREEPESF